jgi:pSer/pThr/pTyr-binding forkhead associated (FHA) protein
MNTATFATPSLQLIYPSEQSTQIPLSSDAIMVGRSPECEVCIQDEWLSRHHCRVWMEKGQVFVEDLGSTNGTFLDGQAISKSHMELESRLQLGKLVFRIQFQANREVTQEDTEYPASAETISKAISPLLKESHLADLSCSLLTLQIKSHHAILNEFDVLAWEFVVSECSQLLERERISGEFLIKSEEHEFTLYLHEYTEEQTTKFSQKLTELFAKQLFQFHGSPIRVEFDVFHKFFARTPLNTAELFQ